MNTVMGFSVENIQQIIILMTWHGYEIYSIMLMHTCIKDMYLRVLTLYMLVNYMNRSQVQSCSQKVIMCNSIHQSPAAISGSNQVQKLMYHYTNCTHFLNSGLMDVTGGTIL